MRLIHGFDNVNDCDDDEETEEDRGEREGEEARGRISFDIEGPEWMGAVTTSMEWSAKVGKKIGYEFMSKLTRIKCTHGWTWITG